VGDVNVKKEFGCREVLGRWDLGENWRTGSRDDNDKI
jgi:hypothetical protein